MKFFVSAFKFLFIFTISVSLLSCSKNSSNNNETVSGPVTSNPIITNGNWEQLSDSVTQLSTTKSLAINGNDIYAATQSFGIFKSSDDGASWNVTATDFPFDHNHISGYNSNELWGMELINNTMIVNVSNSSQIYASTDFGKSWVIRNSGLIQSSFSSLSKSGNRVYLVVGDSKAYYSDNAGATWNEINTAGIHSKYFYGILSLNNEYFVFADSGVTVSTNNGNSWQLANTGLQPNLGLHSGIVSGNNILIGVQGMGVVFSKDGGTTWSVSKGWLPGGYPINCIIEKSNVLFLGSANGSVYYSTDFGTNWKKLGVSPGISNPVISLVAGDKYLYASTHGSGILRYKLY